MRLPADSLSTRLILLMLAALALAQVASLLVFTHERGRIARAAAQQHVHNRIASTVRLLEQTPRNERRAVLRAGQGPGMRLHLAREPRRLGPPESPAEKEFASQLKAELGNSVNRVYVRLRGDPERGLPLIAAGVELPGGPWLLAVKLLPEPPPRWSAAGMLALALSVLFVVAAVIFGVRGITGSLRRLADAADRLGRGEAFVPLAETGPPDLRRSVRAFNRMGERLQRFIAGRTRMLAAISHDLRTPLTVLRLRAEFIEDEENRQSILDSIEDMQKMTEATLDFARSDNQTENTLKLNFAVLLDSLCDDYRALGAAVELSVEQPATLHCRPAAMKRALRNLIDNGLAYGQSVELILRDGGSAVEPEMELAVVDNGPGIADADRARVFDPFVRLEGSRNQDTGGIGLGLAIARNIARAHGGDIDFSDRADGRFEVILRLPGQQAASA